MRVFIRDTNAINEQNSKILCRWHNNILRKICSILYGIMVRDILIGESNEFLLRPFFAICNFIRVNIVESGSYFARLDLEM